METQRKRYKFTADICLLPGQSAFEAMSTLQNAFDFYMRAMDLRVHGVERPDVVEGENLLDDSPALEGSELLDDTPGSELLG